jgi:peptidoglycan/LPS O-acetylase OafA/YrhL
VVAILATCSVLLFARFGETKVGASIFRHGAFLGNATYSSYLVHFPIQLGIVIVANALGYDRFVFFSPVCLVSYLAVVTGVSCAVFHLLEVPA